VFTRRPKSRNREDTDPNDRPAFPAVSAVRLLPPFPAGASLGGWTPVPDPPDEYGGPGCAGRPLPEPDPDGGGGCVPGPELSPVGPRPLGPPVPEKPDPALVAPVPPAEIPPRARAPPAIKPAAPAPAAASVAAPTTSELPAPTKSPPESAGDPPNTAESSLGICQHSIMYIRAAAITSRATISGEGEVAAPFASATHVSPRVVPTEIKR
jgi:hypothetical protein